MVPPFGPRNRDGEAIDGGSIERVGFTTSCYVIRNNGVKAQVSFKRNDARLRQR